ncbi:MAG: hypothetical protein EKK40_14490 [Bradyrhizobiaceae bacterium]|nr:MAG: hypothetical protein EKK40_14490 [Bradyrhizobiaceae bacterium]
MIKQLRRDIVIIVSIKVLIVLAAAFFVFGPKQRPHIDDSTVRGQLLNDSISDSNNRSPYQ